MLTLNSFKMHLSNLPIIELSKHKLGVGEFSYQILLVLPRFKPECIVNWVLFHYILYHGLIDLVTLSLKKLNWYIFSDKLVDDTLIDF
jgi:hypothetical protein